MHPNLSRLLCTALSSCAALILHGGAAAQVGLPRELTVDEAAERAVRAAEAGAVLALESELGAIVVSLAAA